MRESESDGLRGAGSEDGAGGGDRGDNGRGNGGEERGKGCSDGDVGGEQAKGDVINAGLEGWIRSWCNDNGFVAGETLGSIIGHDGIGGDGREGATTDEEVDVSGGGNGAEPNFETGGADGDIDVAVKGSADEELGVVAREGGEVEGRGGVVEQGETAGGGVQEF